MSGLEWLKPAVIFGSVLYALIGVLIFWIAFILVDKLTPYRLWEEIIEKKNLRWRSSSARCASRSA